MFLILLGSLTFFNVLTFNVPIFIFIWLLTLFLSFGAYVELRKLQDLQYKYPQLPGSLVIWVPTFEPRICTYFINVGAFMNSCLLVLIAFVVFLILLVVIFTLKWIWRWELFSVSLLDISFLFFYLIFIIVQSTLSYEYAGYHF